jgi:hypothetical protein
VTGSPGHHRKIDTYRNNLTINKASACKVAKPKLATCTRVMVGLAGLSAHTSTDTFFVQMTYTSRHQCKAGRLENLEVGLAAAKKLHYGRQTSISGIQE